MLRSQREKFSLQRKHAYINCAYMSPLMKKVENAGIKGIKKKRTPFKVTQYDFFHDLENLRLLYSKLIDNKESSRIATIPSVSYGMANVAKNVDIADHQHIVLIGEQFPSNVYPWKSIVNSEKQLRFVTAPPVSDGRGKQWNDDILNAIDENTKLVSLANIHWADGTLFDLMAIRKRTQAVGALLVIDGTQSVGALPISINELQPDALICASYKCLMGPYSFGLAYYGEAFDNGTPIEENWINRLNSDDFAGLVNYEDQYSSGSLRYGVGEQSNFILVPMQIAATKQLLKWNPANVQEYCESLVDPILPEITSLGCWIEDKQYRASNLFGIYLPEKADLEKVKKVFKKNRVHVSFRGKAIRISPQVYNDAWDMKKLTKSLHEALA